MAATLPLPFGAVTGYRRCEDARVRPPPPIAFNTVYEAEPGVPWSPAPGVRCVLAPNPGPYTLTGTNTYLVGESELAVIDPGPDDDAHLAALLAVIGTTPVSHILVTHTHIDHSPLVPKLAAATGAEVVAFGPHPPARLAKEPDDTAESGDQSFRPDRQLVDGDVVRGDGWAIEAMYTPGHIGNHLCFASNGVLWSGDHIMGWSTTVITPTDGDLVEFLDSCERLLARPESVYLSAHGAPITDPKGLVGAIVEHRQYRHAQVLDLVTGGVDSVPTLVERIYPGLDERLFKAARGTVLSHLLALSREGRVVFDGTASASARVTAT
jgi:glyoxylase-like metal-dependent hydrolase (beta-lactamase superfamily II)